MLFGLKLLMYKCLLLSTVDQSLTKTCTNEFSTQIGLLEQYETKMITETKKWAK